MAYEREIEKALRSLKNQGIPVSPATVDAEGNVVFKVIDFKLTEHQIVTFATGKEIE